MPYPIPTPTKKQNTLTAQLCPVSAMTNKDRRGINNFATNTRARNNSAP